MHPLNVNAARVLVVEDQPDLAAVVRDLLADDARVEVVAVCHTLAIAGDLIERAAPDVVVTDFRLPDGDAADVFARWQTSSPRMKIVVVSAWTDEGSVRRARLAGAHAYLDKATELGELVDTVVRVYTGHAWGPGRWPGTGSDGSAGASAGESADNDEQTAARVLAGIRAGATTGEIAVSLGLDERVVREHVNVLLRRHGVRSRADLRRITP